MVILVLDGGHFTLDNKSADFMSLLVELEVVCRLEGEFGVVLLIGGPDDEAGMDFVWMEKEGFIKRWLMFLFWFLFFF